MRVAKRNCKLRQWKDVDAAWSLTSLRALCSAIVMSGHGDSLYKQRHRGCLILKYWPESKLLHSGGAMLYPEV